MEKITDVKVLNAGIGYSSTSTINVISSGSGAIIQSKIRPLTVNDAKRFENENYLIDDGNLQYTVSGYIQKVYNSFRETPGRLSEIIGWAYDGNPIYGPNGYINPKDATSDVKTLVSSYILDVASVVDRPSGFDDGFFIEDYKFDGSGDLDEYNGRFSITKEFPNGVYAYYATLNENIPTFPYFIGNEYKSTLLDENQTLDQSFDFSDTNILRNTYPYRISDNDSDYEFVPKN